MNDYLINKKSPTHGLHKIISSESAKVNKLPFIISLKSFPKRKKLFSYAKRYEMKDNSCSLKQKLTFGKQSQNS